jgi:hypothetical protein
MIKTLLVAILVSSLCVMTPQTTFAQMLSAQEIISGQKPLSQQALENLENPEIVKKLAEYGITKEEARQRIAGLSDVEIQKVLDGQYQQAGGDLLIIVLLVIIIIILVRH